MPLADGAFDVVLCQMGLQFFPDRPAALREMHRVLKPEGRVHLNVPGPRPEIFAIMADGLARHLGPQAATFIDAVFTMHDADELAELMRGAGFREVNVHAGPVTLRLPSPRAFLWQYVHSTPLAGVAGQADDAKLDALEREVCDGWREFTSDGALSCQVTITTGSGVR